MRFNQWLSVLALIAIAFLAGRMSNGPVAKAAADNMHIDVRAVGAESALIVTYPDEKKVYVYANPFIGGPDQYCAYSFTFTSPGAPIKRSQCPPPQ